MGLSVWRKKSPDKLYVCPGFCVVFGTQNRLTLYVKTEFVPKQP